jgi:hypothetical protein
MKKIILLLAALLTLAGCVTPSSSPIAAHAGGGTTMFGTLAAFGTFEMQLAPAYTRLAVLRHNAAQDLRAGRISVPVAQSIQDTADAARKLLDAAHEETADGKERLGAREKLNAATGLIAGAEKMLEKKP